MTDLYCSPYPPVLQFTPEVQSGMEAVTTLAFGPALDDDSVVGNLKRLAEEIVLYAPELAEQLVAMGLED